MKSIRVLQWSLVIVLGLIVLAQPARARACEPADDNPLRCARRTVTLGLAREAGAAVAPPKAAAPVKVAQPQVATTTNVRHGTTPADALDAATAGWQTIAPGQNAWWNLGLGKDAQILNVWLDANGQEGLGLSIFAPDISAGLSTSTKPTGRGSYNKFEPGHALTWRGQSPRGGIWYALVTNSNSVPIPYHVSYERTGVDRECRSYWEIIGVPWAGPTDPIYWTFCQ